MNPRKPIRKKRPGIRRGELTPAQKEDVRRMAFNRAWGCCELHIDGTCQKGPLPWDGPLYSRGHLVHLRNRTMYGWGEQNVCWGCARCHLDLMHVKGVHVPKTYDELIAWNRERHASLKPVATASERKMEHELPILRS